MLRRNHKFTLVELLVSLGVFSILLVIFMQFFSGMRLAWTNSEKRSNSHFEVRVAMDMLTTLISSMHCIVTKDASDHTVLFPFKLKRANGDEHQPAALYFASKTNIDLPGTNPVRFVGVQYVNPINDAFKFGLTDEKRFYNLYLTVISNAEKDAEEKDISDKNREIFHRFWPAPTFLDKDDAETDALGALKYMEETLDEKLKLPDNGNNGIEHIKLLERVTEFKVRLFKVDGSEYSKNDTDATEVPCSLEITISVLRDSDFETWINTGKNDDFKRKNQLTLTRRIHIGDRWKMEDKYDQYQ